MTDPFANFQGGLDSPASHVEAVAPADADLTAAFRALYVGGAGDVKVRAIDGSDATFVGVPAGAILSVRVARVWATGTTATFIVGLR